MRAAAAAIAFGVSCRCSMKKLQERLQKNEMGVSDSDDEEQQEALLQSSGLMPKSAQKEEEDDSKVINLNHIAPGQGVMVVVPSAAANSAMYPNSAVSAAVQAAANAAAAGDAHSPHNSTSLSRITPLTLLQRLPPTLPLHSMPPKIALPPSPGAVPLPPPPSLALLKLKSGRTSTTRSRSTTCRRRRGACTPRPPQLQRMRK